MSMANSDKSANVRKTCGQLLPFFHAPNPNFRSLKTTWLACFYFVAVESKHSLTSAYY